MTEGQTFKKKPKKKKKRHADEENLASPSKKKLKELDDFIEGVLQEAGDEFLDEFRQVEGE
jgi:hypothetical protein